MGLSALDTIVSGTSGFGLTNYDKLKENFDYLIASPPAAEMAYVAIGDVGPAGVAQTGSGDRIGDLPAATLENVKHYIEVWGAIAATVGTAGFAVSFNLYEGATNLGEISRYTPESIGNNYVPIFMRAPFTPAAGSHTYTLRWTATNDNTWSILSCYARVVRA